MSEHQSICEMLKKAEHDASLREALQAATTPEEVVEAASAAGCAVSVEEVEAFRTEVQAVQQRVANGELSEAELAGVAGGFDPISAGLLGAAVLGGVGLVSTAGVGGGVIGGLAGWLIASNK